MQKNFHVQIFGYYKYLPHKTFWTFVFKNLDMILIGELSNLWPMKIIDFETSHFVLKSNLLAYGFKLKLKVSILWMAHTPNDVIVMLF